MAETVKHTPGPWKAALEGNGYNGAVYVMAGDDEICEVFDDGNKGPLPDRANASLISAAPDLLMTGKHLFVKLAEVYQATGQKISDCQALRGWLAAVAKAEGRS